MTWSVVSSRYSASTTTQTGVSLTAGQLIIVGTFYNYPYSTANPSMVCSDGVNTYTNVNTSSPIYGTAGTSISTWKAVAKTTTSVTISISSSYPSNIFIVIFNNTANPANLIKVDSYSFMTPPGSLQENYVSGTTTLAWYDGFLFSIWFHKDSITLNSPYWTDSQGYTPIIVNSDIGLFYQSSFGAPSYSDQVTTQAYIYAGNLLISLRLLHAECMMGILE